MKSKIKYIVVVLVMAILLPISLSAVSEATVIFLTLEPGGRAGGMGKAHTAASNSAFANYWNLGETAFNRSSQVAWSHSNWFGDVRGLGDMYWEYVAFNTYLMDIGNVGFNIQYLTYGEQQATNTNNQDQGTFESYEIAPAISYSFQLSQNIGIGTNFKFIYSNLSPEGMGGTDENAAGKGSSFAFDFAIKGHGIHTPYFRTDKLDWGFSLQNLGPDLVFMNEDQHEALPLTFRTGLAYKVIDDQYNKFLLTGDMSKLLANDDMAMVSLFTAWADDSFQDEFESTIFTGGAEWVYLNMLALRGGYIYDKAGEMIGPHFGAGFQYDTGNMKISIDFALEEPGDMTSKRNKVYTVSMEF